MHPKLVLAIHQRRDLDKVERALLLSLAIHFRPEDGKCCPSYTALIETTGWSRRSLIEATKNLQSRGILTVRKSYRNSNSYVLNLGFSSAAGAPLSGAEVQDMHGSSAVHAHPVVQPVHPEVVSRNSKGSEREDSDPAGAPLCPHQDLIDLYHHALSDLPRVRVWHEGRRKMLAARWKEDPKRQSLEWWRRFFEYIARSDFLMGRTEKPFRCTLEWIVQSKNFAKIIEGNYHGQRKSA